jgi:hypothetical protein
MNVPKDAAMNFKQTDHPRWLLAAEQKQNLSVSSVYQVEDSHSWAYDDGQHAEIL